MTPGLPDGTGETPFLIPDHELLTMIDRGGYGEIWLARNVTGTYRAVKIVRRDHFEDDIPFDREFKGIEAYEPVSRGHPNLVAVLHIGRQADAFYYIMELADPLDGREADSGHPATIDPERYQPKTLREEIKREGSLPVDRCLAIALSLAKALGHLHDRGLVHRDIKPSNVIFVGGGPKLADVGLVTDADHTLSLVGTEGFIPPEGPGSAPADIFALGTVLYEMSTGRDRKDFPELPTSLRADPELRRRIEFNEVVLKAAAKDPEERYCDTAGLVHDLETLRAGGSLVRSRRVRRITRSLVRVGLAAVLVGGLVALGVILGLRDDTESGPSQPVSQMKVTILDTGTLELHLKPALVLGRARTWDFSPDGQKIVSANSGQLVRWDRERGSTETIALENPEGWYLLRPRWGPHSKKIYSIAKRAIPGTPQETAPPAEWGVLAVDPNGGTPEVLHRREEIVHDFSICPATGRLAIAVDPYGSPRIYWLDPADGSLASWDSEGPVFKSRFGEISPDGRWLAVQRNENPGGRLNIEIWLVPTGGGEPRRLTGQEGVDAFATWAPDGRAVFFASGDSGGEGSTWNLFRLGVDPESGQPNGVPVQVTKYASARVFHPKVVRNGREIAFGIVRQSEILSSAKDGDPESVREIGRGRQVALARDGRRAFFVVQLGDLKGIYRIDLEKGQPERLTSLLPLGGDAAVAESYDVSPDGASITFVARDSGETALLRVDATGTRTLQRLTALPPTRQCVPRWSPDGRWIAFAVDRTLAIIGADGTGYRELATLFGWEGWTLRWSPDGTRIAAFGYGAPAESRKTNHAYVVAVSEGASHRITPVSEPEYKEGLEWHPDGDRLTYMYYGPQNEGSEIRVAYPDGRPTELLVDQPDHWDYVGWWHPDGRRLFFNSNSDDEDALHVFDSGTGAITHSVVPPASESTRPHWSWDGTTVVWATKTVTKQFVAISGFDR